MNGRETAVRTSSSTGRRRGRRAAAAACSCSRSSRSPCSAAARRCRTTSTRSGSSSLGFAAVFWTTLNLQADDFRDLRGRDLRRAVRRVPALKPASLGEFSGILINGQPIKLPVEPVLRLIALGWSRGHRRGDRRRHDGGVADARALLVRAVEAPPTSARSDLRPAAHLLPVHAAGLAADHRLADDARRHRLRGRGVLRRRHAAARACSADGSARRRGRRPPGAACRSPSRRCC